MIKIDDFGHYAYIDCPRIEFSFINFNIFFSTLIVMHDKSFTYILSLIEFTIVCRLFSHRHIIICTNCVWHFLLIPFWQLTEIICNIQWYHIKSPIAFHLIFFYLSTKCILNMVKTERMCMCTFQFPRSIECTQYLAFAIYYYAVTLLFYNCWCC